MKKKILIKINTKKIKKKYVQKKFTINESTKKNFKKFTIKYLQKKLKEKISNLNLHK